MPLELQHLYTDFREDDELGGSYLFRSDKAGRNRRAFVSQCDLETDLNYLSPKEETGTKYRPRAR